MKMFLTALAAVAALGIVNAGSALAQSTGSMPGDAMKADHAAGSAMHDAMHDAKPMLLCRPAASSETASAKMTDGSGLVCKKLDRAMVMKGPGTPDTTPARMEDKAWLDMLEHYMYVGNN